MIKRILIGGIIAVVVSGLLLVYFFSKANTFVTASAAEAVSGDAILFADKIDYEYFTGDFASDNPIWNELKSTNDSFHQFDSLLMDFSMKLESYPLLRDALESEPLSVSVHLLGKSKLAVLLYLSVGEKVSAHDLESEMDGIFGAEAIINERRYEAVVLKDVSLARGSAIPSITYGSKDGLLMVSSTSILVEDAIRNLNSKGGIYHNKGFQKVSATAGRYVHANIYLNYPVLDQLFYPSIESSSRSLLKNLSKIAEWGELDADVNEEAIVLNGMTFSKDSLDQFLNLFAGQSPVKMESPSVIPSNTTRYLWLGISNTTLFKTGLEEYLREQGRLQQFRSIDNKLQSLCGASPFNDILEILNDEIFWLKMDGSEAGEEHVVAGIEVNSRSEAINRLTAWTDTYAEQKGIEHFRLISKYRLDDQTTYDIYQLPEKMYEGFFPEQFIKSYFAFYERYIFFSDSKDAISRVIYQNVLHKTLANEAGYSEVNNYLSSKGNLTLYVKPDSFLESISGVMADKASRFIASIQPGLKKIPALVFQYVEEGDMFYTNFTLKYNSQVKEKSLTEWESLLDSVAIIKPALVTNHNTSGKEILVQDATNALYLINSTGRVLWKVKLEGPIESEIFQIDYFKNGKLQYLFNTGKSLHLIDRNGNNVERYPVKFRADATNGIALFDYDNRSDYRIFVACSDRRVYVYNIEGNIIPGWDFNKSEGVVEKPIQHFRIKEKDYIVFSDPIRAYILDRRGKERVKQKNLAVVSENNLFYLDMNLSGEEPRLLTTDTSGNVIAVDFSGDVKRILTYEATPEHYFRIEDIDQDGSADYIYADGNELKVIDSEGKRFFSYKIKSDIKILPDVYQFSASDLKIGITDSEQNRIYLFNSDGSLYEGFPIEGNTRYSIGYFSGSDSRFNLIVGSSNGFIYNYSIE